MKQGFDEATLSAYMDGELDAATIREVGLFLERDEDARRYVIDAVRTTALLKADMNEALHDEVPERLLSVLRLKRRRLLERRFPLRMVAVLLLILSGFGSGMLVEQNSRERSPTPTMMSEHFSDMINEALEFSGSGTSRKWQESGTRVITVSPVKTYRDQNGQYYREYRLEVTSKNKSTQVSGLAHRDLDGKWKTKVLFF